MKKNKKLAYANRGFTLVELLIVIGLLGAIALIVIAAINPIEQTNRARDTRFKADGGQLVSANDRYYAAKNEFPWQTYAPATYTSADLAFGFVTASDANVGICGAAGCTADGTLITSNELKTEFRSRDFIQSGGGTAVEKKLMIGKAAGSSASVYACYVPLSRTTREKTCADGKVYTLSTTTGVRTKITAGSASCAPDSATWISGPQYVCIPE